MAPVVDYHGGHHVQLLRGGDELFPALIEALAVARHEVWLATYIFNDDRERIGRYTIRMMMMPNTEERMTRPEAAPT